MRASGSAGTGAGQLKEAKGVAADAHNNIWVADTGNSRIEKFNEKGEFVAAYGFGVSNGEAKFETCTSACHAGTPGSGHGQFEKPRTLTVDGAGNVWITDTGNNRVEELNEKGEYLRVFGSTGAGNGQFSEPIGITVDPHGNVWVTDAGNSRVEELNEKGEYDTQFGTKGSENGQLNEPWSIQVNTHSEIFVSDSANYRIQKYAPTGVEVPENLVYAAKFGSSGSGSGQLGAGKGIALDGKGDVVIADEGNARLDVFKENGEFVKVFGSPGSEPGHFGEIKGIAIDSKGNIWVADQGNSRISNSTETVNTFGRPGPRGRAPASSKKPRASRPTRTTIFGSAATGNSRIEKFNEKGEFVAAYGFGVSNGEEKYESCTSACHPGNPGTGHGQFNAPRTLAVDAAGNVWVTNRATAVSRSSTKKANTCAALVRPAPGTASSANRSASPSMPTATCGSPTPETAVSRSSTKKANTTRSSGPKAAKTASSTNRGASRSTPTTKSSSATPPTTASKSTHQPACQPTPPAPSISGELISGQTLTANPGSWTGAAALKYTYQWEDCNASGESCSTIPGATAATHLLAASETGHTLPNLRDRDQRLWRDRDDLKRERSRPRRAHHQIHLQRKRQP